MPVAKCKPVWPRNKTAEMPQFKAECVNVNKKKSRTRECFQIGPYYHQRETQRLKTSSAICFHSRPKNKCTCRWQNMRKQRSNSFSLWVSKVSKHDLKSVSIVAVGNMAGRRWGKMEATNWLRSKLSRQDYDWTLPQPFEQHQPKQLHCIDGWKIREVQWRPLEKRDRVGGVWVLDGWTD